MNLRNAYKLAIGFGIAAFAAGYMSVQSGENAKTEYYDNPAVQRVDNLRIHGLKLRMDITDCVLDTNPSYWNNNCSNNWRAYHNSKEDLAELTRTEEYRQAVINQSSGEKDAEDYLWISIACAIALTGFTIQGAMQDEE